jgi:hypothetical protein
MTALSLKQLTTHYFTHLFPGESVFRVRKFNVVGFLLFILLGPSSSTHIFHRICSIDNGSVPDVCLKMVLGPKHVAQ